MKTDKFIIIANLVYILGIIMGLYLQISIVFLLCLTLVSILYLIIKSNIKEIIHDKIVQFIEKKRFIVISKGISKVKVGRKKQKTRPIQFITISVFVIIVLISNILTINKSKILNMYNKLENICVIGEIVNLEKQNDYYMIYKVSVKNINESNIRKKPYVLVKIKKNNKNNFKLGDIIKVNGKIENPDEQKNYRGFNYKRYLQGKNIATVVVGDTAYKLNKTNKKNIYYIKNKIIELSRIKYYNYNIKFMSIDTFIKRVTFDYDEKTIYSLMKEYNYNYSTSLVYLDNLNYISNKLSNNKMTKLKEIKDYLDSNKLLIYDNLFKEYVMIII